MKKRAFTLFELLVSISIIGILIAVASLSYGSAQKKARDARRIEDMNSIQKAAEMYYSQNNYVYPANTNAFVGTGGTGVMQQYPKDPKTTGWTPYSYQIGRTYCACATMDNSSNGNCTLNTCNFNSAGSGGTGPLFCVKSQQ